MVSPETSTNMLSPAQNPSLSRAQAHTSIATTYLSASQGDGRKRRLGLLILFAIGHGDESKNWNDDDQHSELEPELTMGAVGDDHNDIEEDESGGDRVASVS